MSSVYEYESKRKREASVKLAYFRSIIGKSECINICEKYINDNIDNENNDMLSYIMAELIFDDSTYFRFIYISFQKDGVITDDNRIVAALETINTLKNKGEGYDAIIAKENWRGSYVIGSWKGCL